MFARLNCLENSPQISSARQFRAQSLGERKIESVWKMSSFLTREETRLEHNWTYLSLDQLFKLLPTFLGEEENFSQIQECLISQFRISFLMDKVDRLEQQLCSVKLLSLES